MRATSALLTMTWARITSFPTRTAVAVPPRTTISSTSASVRIVERRGRGHATARRGRAPGSAPTVYLWVADRAAIGSGVWSISPRYTLGWDPLGLFVEEAVLFLMTNVLIIQGILMFHHGIDRRPLHYPPRE